jgi:hypothetical protein
LSLNDTTRQKGVIQESQKVGNRQAVCTDNEYQQGNHGEIEYPRRGITVEIFSASEIVENKSGQQHCDTQEDK